MNNFGDSVKIKLLMLLISTVLVGVCVLLYFADRSLAWGTGKILSCIFINLWLFFMAPALRGSYIKNRTKSTQEWFIMGMEFGASCIALPVLFAPYYGVKYYFTGSRESL